MSNARNIGDSAPVINFLDNVTSDVQTQLNTLDTAIGNISVTSGSLTKTFAADETATVTLSGNVLAPSVTVTKEIAQTGVTNNDWDAAAGSYTLEDSAPATTLNFSFYEISSATYDSTTFSTPQEAVLQGVAFKTDGTKMFVTGSQDKKVQQYSLSTAWDISTASFDSVDFSLSSQDTFPTGLTFSADGTELYAVGNTNGNTYQYSLSSAFDMTTASYTRTYTSSSQDNDPQGVQFNSSGTRMFIAGKQNHAICEYELSTAWDISTASYTDSFSVSSQTTSLSDVAFDDTGKKMFVIANSPDEIFQYNLTTAFDVSTASYSNKNFSYANQEADGMGLAFNNDGTKFYIAGADGDHIIEYDMTGSSLSLGSGSFASGDVGKTIYANSGSVVLTDTAGSYTVVTALSSTNQVASGDWQMYALVYDSTADVIALSNYAEGYDLASLVSDGVSGNVNQDNNPNGVAFSADGSKMYTVGSNGDAVYEYALSTAFNPSTLTYTQNFSVASLLALPEGIFFKPDGTKFFIIDANNYNDGTQGVYAYDMSTAWDISTASYNSDYITIGGTNNGPRDVWFSSDGTKMFWCGAQGNHTVYKWTLSTAWDVSTATATQSLNINVRETGVKGLVLSSDGTKLYTIGQGFDTINQWTMSTAYDLSTATWQNNAKDISAVETQPTGITFNADGTKLYIVGTYTTHVNQFTTQQLYAVTGYQPAISSTIDSTYWTDLNSMTATNAVGNGNVFYAISNDAKANWSILDNSSGVRKIVKNNGGTYQVNTNSTYGSETWANAATNTEVAALREAMTSASSTLGYSLASPSYVQHYNTGSESLQTSDVAFNADGTKMYVLSIDPGGMIYQYSLSTAYDISTASYDSVTLNVTAQSVATYGFHFKPDGTKLYVSAVNTDVIYEYALSTGFDLSSASYTDSFATGLTHPMGIDFSPDGTKMILGTNGASVQYYTLSTAWDVSTATSVGAMTAQGAIRGVSYNADGTKLFACSYTGDEVFQYSLSTAYDATTGSYDSVSYDTTSQTTTPTGLLFADSGTKMYVVDADTGSDGVYQYTTTETNYINQMTSTELAAINDASQITLGTALDLATIIYYASGSSTPTYSGTAINYDANVMNQGAILGTDYTYDAPAQNKVRVTSNNAANLKIRVV